MSKPVFVTGAEGFIGSHVVEELLSRGWEVRAMSLYNSFNQQGWLETVAMSNRAALQIVASDVRDAQAVRRLMKGCGAVAHLAALIGIPYSYEAPYSYVETNIVGTLNVLQAAVDLGIERVIQTSTSEVYGSAQFTPMREDHPLHAQSPYAATKIGADQLALSFYRSFGVPVVVLRPFNNYGPRQSTRAVIPTLITQMLAGRERIKLGSLTPTRDFLFVKDTAVAFAQALELGGCVGHVINLGTGFEISIGRVFTLLKEIIGADCIAETEDERIRPERSEVTQLVADQSKALELLQWSPRFRGLEGLKSGLAESVGWYRANLREFSDSGYVR